MRSLLKGRVVSAKLPLSVTVLVERRKMHPLYRKSVQRSKRYLTHDLLGAKLGDVVEIVKVKPISKNKHFQTVKILGQDIAAVVSEQLKEEAAQAIARVMPEEQIKSDKSDKSEEQTKSASQSSESTDTQISSDLSENPKPKRRSKK